MRQLKASSAAEEIQELCEVQLWFGSVLEYLSFVALLFIFELKHDK
jgi:hypothetical protein